MTLAQRLKRLAPFLAIGLAIPLIWSLVVVSLPDDRLAPTDGALIIQGAPGGEVGWLAPDEPLVNVTVRSVGQDPTGGTLAAGDTLTVLVRTHGLGHATVRPEGPPVTMALQEASRTDPGTGETTWTGWQLADAKAGSLWDVQREVVSGAALAGISTVAGAALVGYALGLPSHLRRPIQEIDLPPGVAGVATGIFLGAMLAAGQAGSNLFFPEVADGLPIPGPWALALIGMSVVAALWKRPMVLPNGGRTAAVAGLLLVTWLPAGIVLAWQGQLTQGLAFLEPLDLIGGMGAMAVMAVVAARWLRLRWARLVAAGLLVAPPAYLILQATSVLFVSLPMAVVALAGARDLWGPALVPPGQGGSG